LYVRVYKQTDVGVESMLHQWLVLFDNLSPDLVANGRGVFNGGAYL